MSTRVLLIVFVAGVSAGWLGKTWFEPAQSALRNGFSGNIQIASSSQLVADSSQSSESTAAGLNIDPPTTLIIPESTLVEQGQRFEERPTDTDTQGLFNRLLQDRRYNEAMNLYQEQIQIDERMAFELRSVSLGHLGALSNTKNSNDFSDFITSYLSIHYDDIDALLLLANFNQANGSYLEAIDVYLLAKTYAYTDVDQQNVRGRLNDFIQRIDSIYTGQENWLSLINLYSHIDTSGLMTTPYQYRQALAYLGSGDEYQAAEQLKLLLNDRLVGQSAALALDRLAGGDDATAIIETAPVDSETIALEKIGSQYLVGLTLNRQDDIKLMIDTGASMTTLSKTSFESLRSGGEVVLQERRVFRTAGGVVEGTVYLVSEIALGPYVINDTQIAVLDFDTNRGFDGLLGMNVLRQFRFQIDQENTQLLLSR